MALVSLFSPRFSTAFEDFTGFSGRFVDNSLTKDSFAIEGTLLRNSRSILFRQTFRGLFDPVGGSRLRSGRISGFDVLVGSSLRPAYSVDNLDLSIEDYTNIAKASPELSFRTLFGGPDLYRGSDSDDRLAAYEGDDSVVAKQGDDVLEGGLGRDRLLGKRGGDLIDGEEGDDRLIGGKARDTLLGGQGSDEIFAGPGRDRVDGGEGNDSLSGKSSKDSLAGSLGDDDLFGNRGEDLLQGGEGNDSLVGNKNRDSLSGGLGEDVLRGGSGSDVLDGQQGADLLTGGLRKDRFVTRDGASPAVTLIDRGRTQTRLRGGNGLDVITDFSLRRGNRAARDQIFLDSQLLDRPYRPTPFLSDYVAGDSYFIEGVWEEDGSSSGLNRGDFVIDAPVPGTDLFFFVASRSIDLTDPANLANLDPAFFGTQILVLDF